MNSYTLDQNSSPFPMQGQSVYYGNTSAEVRPRIDGRMGGKQLATPNGIGQPEANDMAVFSPGTGGGHHHTNWTPEGPGLPDFRCGYNNPNWNDKAPPGVQLQNGLHQQHTDPVHTGFEVSQTEVQPCLDSHPSDTGSKEDVLDTTSARHEMIGIILSNGIPRADKYQCHFRECGAKIFARLADLKRHHSNFHLIPRPEFWCQIPDCDRSYETGQNPFPRNDKLKSHVLKMHGHRAWASHELGDQ